MEFILPLYKYIRKRKTYIVTRMLRRLIEGNICEKLQKKSQIENKKRMKLGNNVLTRHSLKYCFVIRKQNNTS